MKSMTSNGQVSLEYMLVFAALASIFFLALPALVGVIDAVFFSLDILHAHSFLSRIEQRINQMQVLGNGSRIHISANPLERWELQSDGEGIQLTAHYKDANKTFSIPTPADVNGGSIVSGFVIVEKKGHLVVIHN
jgi:hypothetical protein